MEILELSLNQFQTFLFKEDPHPNFSLYKFETTGKIFLSKAPFWIFSPQFSLSSQKVFKNSLFTLI